MRVRFLYSWYIIIILLSIQYYIPVASQEKSTRDELRYTQSNHKVYYEEYQQELRKILEPDSEFSFNIDYVILPIAIIAIGIVVLYFVKQIRLNYISEAKDEDTDPQVNYVETEKSAFARADAAVDMIFSLIPGTNEIQDQGILENFRRLFVPSSIDIGW